MLQFVLQCTFNGLVLGLTYVLISSGLSLVLGIARIINFAHGEFYMLGAFSIYWLCEKLRLNYFLSIPISFLVIGFLGLFIDRYLFRRVRGKFLPSVIVACGVAFLIPGLAMISFGERDKYVETIFRGQFSILGVSIALERVVIILVCLAIIGILAYFVKYCKTGKAMRAVAQDMEAAALQGINADRICALSMFIGCGFAAVAGALMGPIFFVSPFMGSEALIKGFIVILLGGVGTIIGSLIGGLFLGFVEAFGYSFIGTGTDIIVFVVVIIVLLVRPGGLLGREWVLE